jgi:hypothetical protein
MGLTPVVLSARLVERERAIHIDHRETFVWDGAEGLGTAAGCGSQLGQGQGMTEQFRPRSQGLPRLAFKMNGAKVTIRRGG